jgi:hypothetical protein
MRNISTVSIRRREYMKDVKHFCFLCIMIILILIFAGCATANNYDYKGAAADKTPYDYKYKKVQKYLLEASRFQYEEDRTSEAQQNSGLSVKGIRDSLKGTDADYWQLPAETEMRGKGDCEDKAIWLYTKLIEDGFTDIRLVIGKYRESRASFHAWVVWYPGDRVYILDPTKNKGIWRAIDYPAGYYKPYYSFYKDKRWHHKVTALVK